MDATERNMTPQMVGDGFVLYGPLVGERQTESEARRYGYRYRLARRNPASGEVVGETGARLHPNGGGVVERGAYVRDTAFVAEDAVVLREASLGDHVRIYGPGVVPRGVRIEPRAVVDVEGTTLDAGTPVTGSAFVAPGTSVVRHRPIVISGGSFFVTLTDEHLTIRCVTRRISEWRRRPYDVAEREDLFVFDALRRYLPVLLALVEVERPEEGFE